MDTKIASAQIKIASAQIGPRWFVFEEETDLSDYDPEKIVTWTFTGKTATTGSMIRAQDGIHDVDAELEKQQGGFRDATAYQLAFNVAFGLEHLEAIANSRGETWRDLSHALLLSEDIPAPILNQYVRRVDPTRTVSRAELNSLKKAKDSSADKGDTEKKGRSVSR